jgi:hypothetical protein
MAPRAAGKTFQGASKRFAGRESLLELGNDLAHSHDFACLCMEPRDHPWSGRANDVLHFHGLHDRDFVARFHLLTWLAS